MDEIGEIYHEAPDSSDDEQKYNPCKLPGNVWEPLPKVVAELYNQLEKSGGLVDLEWRCPGRVSQQQRKTQALRPSLKEAAPSEDEIKVREREKLLHTFEEDDINDKSLAPVTPTVIKTPKTKTPATQKASFDRIFSRVSGQSKDDSKQ